MRKYSSDGRKCGIRGRRKRRPNSGGRMTWQEQGGISEVFYTGDRVFAFERAGNVWMLYGETGNHIKDFRSFAAMHGYIMEERTKKNDGR